MRGVSAPGGRAKFYQVLCTALHLEDGEARRKAHNSAVARPVAILAAGRKRKRALGGTPPSPTGARPDRVMELACRLPLSVHSSALYEVCEARTSSCGGHVVPEKLCRR